MLKEITEEEMRDIVKSNPNENVVIFNDTNKQWYDIRGLSMEQVGAKVQEMCDKGVFNPKNKNE